jgi:hypothetical protein
MKNAKITVLVIMTSLLLGITAFARQIPNATPRFTQKHTGQKTTAQQLGAKYLSPSGAVVQTRQGLPAQMPFWLAKSTVPDTLYNAHNVNFYYDMIGTDPARGAVSTTIPVVIIPVIFTWGNQGGTDNPNQPACGDSVSVVNRIIGSPVFTAFSGTYPIAMGGTGQYEDAFQKANWSARGGLAGGYHVLLNATTSDPITIDGTTAGSVFFDNSCGQAVAGFDINVFDSIIESVYTARGIPKNVLPLFISYNVFLTSGGCCILGYHNSDANDQTYSFAAYNDPGLFRAAEIQDIHALTHELGEWMDDPFGLNPTPPWGHIGQQPGCQNNLEVGDPVTGTGFAVTQGGFLYHPEDLVFHGWFYRQNPSGSVNGLFTAMGTFTTDAGVLCQ